MVIIVIKNYWNMISIVTVTTYHVHVYMLFIILVNLMDQVLTKLNV